MNDSLLEISVTTKASKRPTYKFLSYNKEELTMMHKMHLGSCTTALQQIEKKKIRISYRQQEILRTMDQDTHSVLGCDNWHDVLVRPNTAIAKMSSRQ